MYGMTEEQLKQIVLNEELINELTECHIRATRLHKNRMMYEVFTPVYLKWWHRLTGNKPYMNFNYQPKL